MREEKIFQIGEFYCLSKKEINEAIKLGLEQLEQGLKVDSRDAYQRLKKKILSVQKNNN